MTWIVAITAVAVIVIVVLAATLRHRRMSHELAAERAALDDSRRSTEHLETRVATLRQELSEQHRANAELTARLRTAGDARAAGLWSLERLRQSRLAGTPTLRATSGPGINLAADLRDAIALELELMREEVGTYAEVGDVELGNPVSPREALAVLRVVQELAAALAKRSDELKITIERDGDAARVTVRATGWSEAAPNHTTLQQCVAALDGTLELRPEAGMLVAEVRIPDRGS
ncbi:MAG: hypothetical protein ACXWA9_18715 [Acidimicrobiia bacterium]